MPRETDLLPVIAEQPIKDLPLEEPLTLQLRISVEGACCHFYFREEGKKWQVLKKEVNARFLSTATAGGFVGCTYGLYATSNGRSSSNTALFLSLEYEGKRKDD